MTTDVRHSYKLAWAEYKETIDLNMDDSTLNSLYGSSWKEIRVFWRKIWRKNEKKEGGRNEIRSLPPVQNTNYAGKKQWNER